MWCDLPKEERVKGCNCPCVIWRNGKFLACSHWHEGKIDKELSEFVSKQYSGCSYSEIME
jgi:hypothetical protein